MHCDSFDLRCIQRQTCKKTGEEKRMDSMSLEKANVIGEYKSVQGTFLEDGTI